MARKKLTPLETHRAAVEKRDATIAAAQAEFVATRNAEIKSARDVAEKILLVETDDKLTPAERLRILKGLPAWPRIVLGIYNAELKLARKRKKDNPITERGEHSAADEPSDIAYEGVGGVVELGADRIKALCNEARQHLKEGQPAGFVVEISAAEFKRQILRKTKAKTA
jgi:hypothetical protein